MTQASHNLAGSEAQSVLRAEVSSRRPTCAASALPPTVVPSCSARAASAGRFAMESQSSAGSPAQQGLRGGVSSRRPTCAASALAASARPTAAVADGAHCSTDGLDGLSERVRRERQAVFRAEGGDGMPPPEASALTGRRAGASKDRPGWQPWSEPNAAC